MSLSAIDVCEIRTRDVAECFWAEPKSRGKTMDIDQILHTDLFQPQSPSPASSPDHGLLTPPASLDGPRSEQPPFGLFADGLGPFDFLPENPADDSIAAFGMGLRFFGNMPVNDQLAIDPQLVDSPAPDLSDHDSDDAPLVSTSMPSFTVKVGGHGKARRGTIQHGGISKKGSTLHVSALQHHAALPSPASPLPLTSPSPTPGLKAKGLPKPPAILKASSSKKGKAKDNNKDLAVDEDEDDDVPQDWRPSPEVFAKMTSKEKRQLRNKISARNFRVRRKGPSFSPFISSEMPIIIIEYISTLEGDIAERDRLLEAVRSELGSTQSENLALRQEIAVLKKVLLEGGGNGTADLPSLNLPPPAPLPIGLGAANATHLNAIGQGGMEPSGPEIATIEINAAASTSSPSSARTPAFAPNTQKDLPSSPTPGRPFWGGQQHHGLGAMGGRGGVTPVHTTLIPEMNISLWGTAANIERAEKNINPLLNAIGTGVIGKVASVGGVYLPAGGEREKEKENKQPSVSSSVSAFDTFADANMFTMKSLDAYVLYSLAPPLGVDDASDTGCTCGRRWQPNITCNNSIYVNPISVTLINSRVQHLNFVQPTSPIPRSHRSPCLRRDWGPHSALYSVESIPLRRLRMERLRHLLPRD